MIEILFKISNALEGLQLEKSLKDLGDIIIRRIGNIVEYPWVHCTKFLMILIFWKTKNFAIIAT